MPMTKLRSLALTTLVLGCVATPFSWADTAEYDTKALNEQLVMSSLWMQVSGEYKALSYQAFNLAKMRLDTYLESYTGDKKVAIVVDADEAVLDNGAYEAWLIGRNEGYSSKTWAKWMDAAEAKAMPGAVEFLQYADSKDVAVFYITNRREVGRAGTLKNMQELAFPQVNDSQLLMKTDTSNKEPRRQQVVKDHDIALFMGDNLNDFSVDFRVETLEESYAAVEKNKALFGSQFIVLPNPSYGDWEGKVYKNNWKASAAEKDQMRKAHLTSWQPKAE
ncbi:5'-nucleotidase, lipoprotein e(P4) family [Vibrio sp. WJH972]